MSNTPPMSSPEPNVPLPYPGAYPPVPVQQYPEQSQALLALIVSILSFVTCSGLISPVAWYLGRGELNAIDAGRRDPNNRDMARAAWILGIIGTALIGLAILLIVGIAILLAVTGGFEASSN